MGQVIWPSSLSYTDIYPTNPTYATDTSTSTYAEQMTNFGKHDATMTVLQYTSLSAGFKNPDLVVVYQLYDRVFVGGSYLQISVNSGVSWTTVDEGDIASSWTEVRSYHKTLTNSQANNLNCLRVRGYLYNGDSYGARIYSAIVQADDPTPMHMGYIVGGGQD